MITTEQVKELRDKTGVSIMQCKKALEDAGGDFEKAMVLLKKKGAEIAEKKGDRTLAAGAVGAYVHASGNIGGMVELWCETDFVAKNEDFKALARDIAMQVVATNPKFLRAEDITPEERSKATEVFAKEVEGKPENMKAQILEGKLNAYFADMVLLEQPFIKNGDLTVAQMISNAIQKFGEKTEIGKFARFSTTG
ncbi:MAG: elongation factor Ts [Candidatus Paceibacterota bacterium]|jgi:elongation factor Ts